MFFPRVPLPQPADRWREALLALMAAVTLLVLTIVLLTTAFWPWEWALLPLCALVALVIAYTAPRAQTPPRPAPRWPDIEMAPPAAPPWPNALTEQLRELTELAEQWRGALRESRPAPSEVSHAEPTLDPLTGAATHAAFMTRLGLDVEFARRHESALALAIFNIVDFRLINQRFGYEIGNDVLAAVATRIRGRLSQADLLGRLGGDSFGVVWAQVTHGQAQQMIARVLEAVDDQPLELAPTGAHRGPLAEAITVRLRVGLALCPDDGVAAHALLELAEDALRAPHFPLALALPPFAPEPSLAAEYPLAQPDDAWEQDGAPTTLVREGERVPSPMSFIDELTKRHSGIQALTTAMETRHPARVARARNLAELAEETALLLGRPMEEARLVGMAALLHDVGDLGISLEILNKTEALTPEEREFVREHPQLGERLLTSVGGVLAAVAPMVAAHRERWDGTGYPRQLAGEAIPLGGRIVALCDVYDALISDRPYRAAMTLTATIAELAANAGTQFDPAVVRAFIAALNA